MVEGHKETVVPHTINRGGRGDGRIHKEPERAESNCQPLLSRSIEKTLYSTK